MLLNQLTKGNANIQKIVAFENAFERILDIIVEEGSSDGGQELQKNLFVLSFSSSPSLSMFALICI